MMAERWRVAIALTTGDKIVSRCRNQDEARRLVEEIKECIETRTCPTVIHTNGEMQTRTTTINPAHIVDVWLYCVQQDREGY